MVAMARSISRSKICTDILMLEARLWKCGSIEVTVVPSPIEISCAAAGAATRAKARAKRFIETSVRKIRAS